MIAKSDEFANEDKNIFVLNFKQYLENYLPLVI